jgi:pyruvate kinase
MLRTKIVCTLGPASSSPEMIRELVKGGMNVARLNMSHGKSEEHRAMIRAVRDAESEVDRAVSILADLQGPRIRVGTLESPRELPPDGTVVLAPEDDAEEDEIPITYRELARDVRAGDRVLLDDGLLELECEETDGERIRLRVIRGGMLRSNKGINIPGGTLSASSLTEKDLRDLDFLLEEGVEFVGLSFVRQGADVEALKERVDGRALIVAKIEMARALGAMDEILDATDMVMVARGDLGVELPFEKVPMAQKRIIQMANFHGRPVITATQMLESMLESPRPTRAEASDVANAVLDGTDAVMLSGETAVGKYPLLALEAIVRIVREIEGSGILDSGPQYLGSPDYSLRTGATPREHAVAAATVKSARNLNAPAVVTITRSGFSARLVSSHRPPVPVFAVTTDRKTWRQLSAVWGVRPLLAEEVEVSYEALTHFGKQAILETGLGVPGDSVVVTAGFPFHHSGTTNTMRVEHL